MKDRLAVFADSHQHFEGSKGRPPANWNEMLEYNPGNMIRELSSVGLEMDCWNTSIAAYANRDEDLALFVIVHDPEAPTKGGLVGFADGSCRAVTAEQFRSLYVVGKNPPGTVPAANLRVRLEPVLAELKSNDPARFAAAVPKLAGLSGCRSLRAEVAKLLVAAWKNKLLANDAALVDQLAYWVTPEHLETAREIVRSNRYQSTGASILKTWVDYFDQQQAQQDQFKKFQEESQRKAQEFFQQAGVAPPAVPAENSGGLPTAPATVPGPVGGPSTTPPAGNLSPAEQRTRWLAELQSGDLFRIKAAAEAMQTFADAQPDEEATKHLVALLDHNSPFVRAAAVGALKKWGTATSVAGLRRMLKSPTATVFEKRDLVPVIREIETRLGLIPEVGETVPASKRLKAGDSVFVQTNDGWVLGRIVQPLPKGAYRVAAGEEGMEQVGDLLGTQLRLPKKATASSATPPATVAASGPLKWTDTTGKFTVEAEFVDFRDGTVTLKKTADGKTLTLPLERLNAESQEQVRRLSRK